MKFVKNLPDTPVNEVSILQSWIFELERSLPMVETGQQLDDFVLADIKHIKERALKAIAGEGIDS